MSDELNKLWKRVIREAAVWPWFPSPGRVQRIDRDNIPRTPASFGDTPQEGECCWEQMEVSQE